MHCFLFISCERECRIVYTWSTCVGFWKPAHCFPLLSTVKSCHVFQKKFKGHTIQKKKKKKSNGMSWQREWSLWDTQNCIYLWENFSHPQSDSQGEKNALWQAVKKNTHKSPKISLRFFNLGLGTVLAWPYMGWMSYFVLNFVISQLSRTLMKIKHVSHCVRANHLIIICAMARFQNGPAVSKQIRQTTKSHAKLHSATNCQQACIRCLPSVFLNWCWPGAQR